jgi:hypothetical protein
MLYPQRKRLNSYNLPGIKVTLDVSDSLLIAEWCRRFHLGILSSPEKSREVGGGRVRETFV